MPNHDELTLLQEENETLAAFLHMLQREYAHLQADFASVLHAAGGHIQVDTAHLQTPPIHSTIERIEDPSTGTVTFRLKEKPSPGMPTP